MTFDETNTKSIRKMQSVKQIILTSDYKDRHNYKVCYFRKV